MSEQAKMTLSNILKALGNVVADYIADDISAKSIRVGKQWCLFKSRRKDWFLTSGPLRPMEYLLHSTGGSFICDIRRVDLGGIKREFGHMFGLVECSFCDSHMAGTKIQKMCNICKQIACRLEFACRERIINDICTDCRDKILT